MNNRARKIEVESKRKPFKALWVSPKTHNKVKVEAAKRDIPVNELVSLSLKALKRL